MNSHHPVDPQNGPSAQTFPHLPNWLKAALLAGLVALAAAGYLVSRWSAQGQGSGAAVEADPEEIAKRMPIQDFILTDGDGAQKKLSDYRGNVVILSFWASWCTPCLVELPTFAELEEKFKDEGLKIVAVNVDEGDDGKVFARDFWSKKKFPFPSYFDTSKAIAQQFEVDMLPSNFVIDRKGRLVFSGFGANDWASPQNIEFIESILRERETESTGS